MTEDYWVKHREDYGHWVSTKYPKDIIDVARRRIKNLMHTSIITTNPLNKLLESAYIQGLIDGAEATKEKE